MQAKVREATSNDPWGPSGTQINELARATFGQSVISPQWVDGSTRASSLIESSERTADIKKTKKKSHQQRTQRSGSCGLSMDHFLTIILFVFPVARVSVDKSFSRFWKLSTAHERQGQELATCLQGKTALSLPFFFALLLYLRHRQLADSGTWRRPLEALDLTRVGSAPTGHKQQRASEGTEGEDSTCG